MGPVKWNALWEWGMRHLLFVLELYDIQVMAGRYFVHEHPYAAASWWVPEMFEFMAKHHLVRIRSCMCRFGMVSTDSTGTGLVKKPTGYLKNSAHIRRQLEVDCLGGHRHVHLMNVCAAAAQIDPEKLCRAILKGAKAQMLQNHLATIQSVDGVSDKNAISHFMETGHDADAVEDYDEDEYDDDISGKPLVTSMVHTARAEEMEEFFKHNVWTKVPVWEAWEVTRTYPIGVRWIDVNKRDVANPEYRSKLVAKKIKRAGADHIFAAMPHLEGKHGSVLDGCHILCQGKSLSLVA